MKLRQMTKVTQKIELSLDANIWFEFLFEYLQYIQFVYAFPKCINDIFDVWQHEILIMNL